MSVVLLSNFKESRVPYIFLKFLVLCNGYKMFSEEKLFQAEQKATNR